MTNNRYEPELKQKVLRLYLEEGRTKKSLTEEYNLGQGTLTYWLQQYRKECDNSPTKREESDSYEVAKKLRKEIEELKKENDLKKKSGSILCEGNRLAQYQFIQKYQQTFGVRWLLRRMNICPNAYYNYLKNKKHEYYQNQRLSVGYLREAKEQTIFKSRKIFQRAGKFTSLDRQKFKY